MELQVPINSHNFYMQHAQLFGDANVRNLSLRDFS